MAVASAPAQLAAAMEAARYAVVGQLSMLTPPNSATIDGSTVVTSSTFIDCRSTPPSSTAMIGIHSRRSSDCQPCPAERTPAAGDPVTSSATKAGDPVCLVAGGFYLVRAYHALPPLIRKPDGLEVAAVLAFCNMLWKLLRDMPPGDKPTHLA